jgi:integrase
MGKIKAFKKTPENLTKPTSKHPSRSAKSTPKDDIGLSAYSNIKPKSRLMIRAYQDGKKDGLCTVYVETTITIKRADGSNKIIQKSHSTGVRIAPEDWSKAKKEIKERNPNHEGLNRKIKAALRAIEDYSTDNIMDAPYLKPMPKELETFNSYFDIKHRKTLIDFLQDYIVYRQAESKRNTWKEFRTLKGRLERFQNHIGKTLYFEDITYEFAEKLKQWAKTVPLDPNTLKEKTFGTLHTVLNYYFKKQYNLNFYLPPDYKDKEEFSKVTGTHESEPRPLYQDEIEKLMQFEPKEGLTFSYNKRNKVTKKIEVVTERFTLNAQYRTKNLFLLSCFTGLRYGDVTKLTEGHFSGDSIVVKANKTKRNPNAKTLFIPKSTPA